MPILVLCKTNQRWRPSLKFLSWLSKMIISAVLICGISIYTTWYTVQTIMEDILKKFNLQATDVPLDLGDWALRLAQHSGLLGTVMSSPADDAVSTSTKTGVAGNPDKPQGVAGSPADSAAASKSTVEEEEAVAAWSQTSAQQSEHVETRQKREKIVMSAEDFYKMKEKLSNEDKAKVFSLLISRLPPEDMQRISAYVENGITGEELKDVDHMVKNKLKPEEYQQLLDIIGKY